MAGNRIAPIFHGLGVAGDAFLREQYCLIRRPREFRLRELLEPLAFSSIDPPQLPRKECERRLAELFSQDAAGMIAQTVAVLKSWKGRNVALGAARWLMSLGPAAAPALGAIDRLATGRRDSYEKQVVQTAADFIRMSLTIEPDAAPDGTATSGRSRIAFLSRANEPTSDHAAVQAELEHLLDNPDAYVRTGAAELLLKPKFARRSSERVIASLEIMLSEVAEVDVGVSELYQIEGGWRHWRCERRSPRASALRALYALKRIPSGPRCFQAMLAESMHAAVTFADGALPQRFPIGQWRQAIAEAGGIEIAEPQIRAISQSYRERRWRGDRWDSAVESELADVIRRLSRRLV